MSPDPGSYISAGKRKHSRTGDAGTRIKPVLAQAAWAAVKGRGRLQDRCNRLVRRSGGPENPPDKPTKPPALASCTGQGSLPRAQQDPVFVSS